MESVKANLISCKKWAGFKLKLWNQTAVESTSKL